MKTNTILNQNEIMIPTIVPTTPPITSPGTDPAAPHSVMSRYFIQ